MNEKKSDLTFYLEEISKGLKKYWKTYLLGTFCVLCINILEMLPALSFKEITSAKKIEDEVLLKIFFLLIVAYFFIGVFRYGWRFFFMINSRKIEAHYKDELFENILTGKFHQSRKLKVGNTVSVLSQDIYDYRMFLGPGVLVLVDIIGYLTVIPIVLYYILGKVALYLLLPFLLIPVYMIYYNYKINKHYVNSSSLLGSVSDHVYEDTRGVKIFRVLGLLGIRKSKFSGLLEDLEKQRLLPHKFDIVLDAVINVSICLSYSVLFYFGVLAISGAEGMGAIFLNIGKVVFTLQIMDKLVWPMIAIGWVASLTQKSFASFKRMRPLFEIDEFEDGSEHIGDSIEAVQLKGFNFSYPGSNDRIIKDVSFELKAGMKIGVVGSVAQGKTTLLKVLAGVFDRTEIEASDRLLVNSTPYGRMKLSSYREKLSYVPQEPVIFNNTLGANVCPVGRINEKRVWEALEYACLTEDIRQMPEGLNTFLGEKGINLSGGQKQRIAIARSFYSKASLYLWDDTISALDVKTEKKVIESIFKINEKSILMLVTHRLSALKNFDLIIILDQGRIIEQGKYDELIVKEEVFYRIQNMEKKTSEVSVDGGMQ